jgi:poly(beta-D-mannuronate) lyase
MSRSVAGLVAAVAWFTCSPGLGRCGETLVRTSHELTAAVAAAQPGDVVRLADGEWRDVDLVVEARGTAERPITIAAATPGQCVITGTSRLRIAGEHLVVSGLLFRNAFHPDAVLEFRRDSKRLALHCRVTECAFLDCNPPAESKEDAKYVSIYGRENRFDHCALTGKTSRGTTLVVWLSDESSGTHRIDGNYFGPRPPLKKNGGETIRIGDSKTSLLSANCVVEENLFDRCSGEAEIISNKSCENTYRHNTFRGCGGALTLRHGHFCTVEGNWFLGEGEKGTGGVRVIGEGHRVVNNYMEGLQGDDARAAICLMSGIQDSPPEGYSPVKDAVIAYNTIVDCKQSLVVGYGDEDVAANVPPRGCLIANNVITGPDKRLLFIAKTPRDFRGDGNVMFPAPSEFVDGLESMVGNPQLLPRNEQGWRKTSIDSILPGSAELTTFAVETDIEGQPRDTKPDAGCDEWSDAPAVFRPLSAGDAGPQWLRAKLTRPE